MNFHEFLENKGSQQKAFTRGDELKHTFFVSRQKHIRGDKWTRTYSSFKDQMEFLEWEQGIEENERRFYEVIRDECTEYYDFDFKMDEWTGATKNEKIQSVINEFLRLRKTYSWEQDFNTDVYKEDDLVILESCGINSKGVDRLSLHVIVRPEVNNKSGRIYKSCTELKKFITGFKDMISSMDTKIVLDMSVYSKNSLMRLEGSHKMTEDRKFKPWGGTKYIKNPRYMFCSYVNRDLYFSRVDMTEEKDEVVLKVTEKATKLTENETTLLFDHIDVKRWDDYDQCMRLVFTGMNLGLTPDDIHAYCSTSKKYDHKWVQNLIDVADKADEYGGSRCGMGTVIHYLKKDVSEEVLHNILPKKNTYSEIMKKNSKRRTTEEKLYIKTIQTKMLNRQIDSLFKYTESKYISIETIGVETQYVQDIRFPRDVRAVGIHASLGGGKTTALIRLVKSLPKDFKVVILSPRITFSKNICAEYNSQLGDDRQFMCYLDYQQKNRNMKMLNFHNKLVMSMESIHNIDWIPDLVIMDECNANLISHVSPETNGKNLDSNMYTLHKWLTMSPKIVVADAFMGSKVCGFFNDLEIRLHIYKYRRRLTRKRAIFLKDSEGTCVKPGDKIERLLGGERKIYAFISTKKYIEELEEQLQKKYRCLIYSGESQNVIPDNLNEEWVKYDLVATTSTITVGINFDKKDEFYTKFIDFRANSKNYVADAIQSHYRVRNITADHIYVTYQDRMIAPEYPINTKKFVEDVEHKKGWYQKQYGGYSTLEPYIMNLVKHNYLEHQLSQSAPGPMLNKYLRECNYECVDEIVKTEEKEIEENEEEEEEKKEPVLDFVEDFLTNFANGPRIGFLEKEKMKRKLTASERKEIDRYWFYMMYTGHTPKGMRDTDISVCALSWWLWSERFNGSRTIKAMRIEKKILEGLTTIKDITQDRWFNTQFPELQKTDLVKINRVLMVCEKLGLKHSNDTDTLIPQSALNNFYMEARDEFKKIQSDMGIQDTRTNKNEVSEKNFVGLVKKVFTESENSMCNLKIVGTTRKGPQRIRENTFKLVQNKEIGREVFALNLQLERHELPKLKGLNISKTLFETLEANEIEEEHIKLL